MTGKTHQALGVTVGLAYCLHAVGASYGPATLAAVLVGSHLSALMPDIDQPAAAIWGSLPFGHTVGQVTDPFLKHRNLSHSLIGTAVFGLVIFWLFKQFPLYWGIDTHILLIVCVLAYLSHLIADMLTVEGIPLFLPFLGMVGLPPKPFDGFRIMTGKWFENLVLFPIINLILLVIVVLSLPLIKSMLFR